MIAIDIILIIILAGFVILGFKSGLIFVVGRIIGLFVGAFVAGHYYLQFAYYFTDISFSSTTIQNFISFIVLFGITSQLVGLVFYLVNKAFDAVAIIPGMKAINRLAGGIFGFFEGVLIISMVLYLIYLFPFSSIMDNFIAGSKFAYIFLNISQIMSFLIPDSVEALREFVF
ncbi:MAG: hypothetical protein AUJ28_00300 [Parcubacteria group bacterium CG1_02_37_51]|uniref:Colicin V production protein n=2 Tax=Candidatus Komeiliibacteriota TaxID=1817908 RepID=A0A2M8DQ15_9BACT|nr:MAG: hypothetical protein AUJ28_00300 [Parcubacteria group bacterium CG1_02_37_51]PIY95171.1 MAG: hypothetical protein COY67_01355 [Candidatus Komeilibacteria bacterium CG_4_10_14_0_8_um_filter_37_78]PJC01023.1 MAG: hypothetical protein CO073_04535 [Candidatus Komeilibacteria bacterium CG_4_9_14_0_8_um_filter_36_9]